VVSSRFPARNPRKSLSSKALSACIGVYPRLMRGGRWVVVGSQSGLRPAVLRLLPAGLGGSGGEDFCGIVAFCVNRWASRSVLVWYNDLITETSRSPGGLRPQPKPILAPRRGERQEDRTVRRLTFAILASLRETRSLGFKGLYFVCSELFARNQDSEKSQCRDNPQFLTGDGLAPAASPREPIVQNEPNWAGRPRPRKAKCAKRTQLAGVKCAKRTQFPDEAK
jgi:hypothetical protein